jgi:hypothetical protein
MNLDENNLKKISILLEKFKIYKINFNKYLKGIIMEKK